MHCIIERGGGVAPRPTDQSAQQPPLSVHGWLFSIKPEAGQLERNEVENKRVLWTRSACSQSPSQTA